MANQLSLCVIAQGQLAHYCLIHDLSQTRWPDKFKAYMKQCREELGNRLIERMFADGTKSKWWQFFSKRKFMGKEMN